MDLPLNLVSGIPANLPAEIFEKLVETPHIRIERIISHGHASPPGFWYDQDRDECVFVIQGAARITFENAPAVELAAGSFLKIPAHARHRVDWTDPDLPTVWLAIHYV